MMFGFNNKRKRNTIIGGGDFDRDGVKNIRDCEPLNWKKQGKEHEIFKGSEADDALKELKDSEIKYKKIKIGHNRYVLREVS